MPSAKLTALFLQHPVQAEYQAHEALRIMAGAGYKLHNFKIYAEDTTERKGREKVQQKLQGRGFFPPYINSRSR